MKKTLLMFSCVLLLSACSESEKTELKGPKPFISMGSNNNSETSIFIEDIILDGKWNGIATGIKSCGSSNINGGGGGGGGPLWETPLPMKTIYVKWFSWKYKKNIKATVELPPKKILEDLYYHPPWYDPKAQGRPKSEIIIDIRPNKKIWVKLAKSSYPRSQDEIMILGEAKGILTDELVTRYRNYKEGKDYSLNCFVRRKELKELGYYTAPLEVWSQWYPGAPQNKESDNEQSTK